MAHTLLAAFEGNGQGEDVALLGPGPALDMAQTVHAILNEEYSKTIINALLWRLSVIYDDVHILHHSTGVNNPKLVAGVLPEKKSWGAMIICVLVAVKQVVLFCRSSTPEVQLRDRVRQSVRRIFAPIVDITEWRYTYCAVACDANGWGARAVAVMTECCLYTKMPPTFDAIHHAGWRGQETPTAEARATHAGVIRSDRATALRIMNALRDETLGADVIAKFGPLIESRGRKRSRE